MKRSLISLLLWLTISGVDVGLAKEKSQVERSPQQPSNAAESALSPRLPEGSPVALQTRNPRYRLRYGDVFQLKFPLTPEFDQERVTVQPDGYIPLTGVPDVHVEGKTIEELEEAIAKAYFKILHEPVASVRLLEFEKPYFIVGGEVRTPGKYEMRGDATVAQAVSIAGGMTPDAKNSNILLFRNVSDQWVSVIEVDLKKMLTAKGSLSEDPHLKPGDMIYVQKSVIGKIRPLVTKAEMFMWWGIRGW